MKQQREKVQPWPGSVFALKVRWEDWITDRHLWVYLERRAPGKFGRLQAMHAIVPKSSKKGEPGLFGSTRYRRGTLDSARELFRKAGVPEDQVADFLQKISREFPYPTANEVFEEEKKRCPTRCSRWHWAIATKSSATIGRDCRN